MSKSFIVELDELDELIEELGLDRSVFLQIKSTGFDGVALSAAIVAITTGGIAAIAKVAVAAINQKSKIKLKINGRDITFEIEGVSEETIIETLSKYLPEKKND